MSELIAPYISRKEYACPCCNALPPDLKKRQDGTYPTVYETFFFAFQKIREWWAKPILWNSGYRCPLHNKAIGGELISVHLFGLAGDWDCVDEKEVDELSTLIIKTIPDLRVGIYKQRATFIHCDMGYLIYPRLSLSWRRGARWSG